MSSVFLLRHSQRSLQRAALDLADTGWQCLGTSQHWQEAAASLRHAMPAYLVSDLHLSDGHASCLLQQLNALPPGVVRPRVLLISDAVDELTLFPALSRGGHAYHLDQPPCSSACRTACRRWSRGGPACPRRSRGRRCTASAPRAGP